MYDDRLDGRYEEKETSDENEEKGQIHLGMGSAEYREYTEDKRRSHLNSDLTERELFEETLKNMDSDLMQEIQERLINEQNESIKRINRNRAHRQNLKRDRFGEYKEFQMEEALKTETTADDLIAMGLKLPDMDHLVYDPSVTQENFDEKDFEF